MGLTEDAALQALRPGEARLLAAVADRIFPRTDTPGAVDAGAVAYVDQALAGAYAALLPVYRRGFRQLNRLARARFGRPFLELGELDQDAVLLALEAAEGAGPGRGARATGKATFFRLVRRHVLEGIFGEPQYGGNRDLVGWRLVGFGGQQYGYADAYINRVVDVPPVADGLDTPAS